MPKQRARPPIALFVLLATILFSSVAAAYAGSITNGSSVDGTPGYITSLAFGAGSAADGFPADDGGCVGCHVATGNAPTNIALDGVTLSTGTPTSFTVPQGTKRTFTLSWTNPAGKTAGGFLVMHNDVSTGNNHGTLGKVSGDATVHTCTGAASGSGSTACNGTLGNATEVMHEVPKVSASPSFDFTYTANSTNVCEVYEFGVWVNAVNHDLLCFTAADFPVFRRFRITTNCDDGNPCTNDTCGATCTHANNSVSCNDGNLCTTGDHCSGGICDGTAVPCPASDQCHNAGTCNTGTGACSNPVKGNGSGCTDGNACTVGDTCQGGSCSPGSNPGCPTPDQCHTAGTCNTSTGICSNPAKGNGTACSDGNSCTSGETCQSGTCTGGMGMTCPLPGPCHLPGSCSGGTCSDPIMTNGTPCSDGNACTVGDACQAGSCVPGTAVVCPTPDQCHTAGTCNTTTGICSNPAKTNGSTCNDGLACTTPDTCTGGTCGGPARDCNDGITCTHDSCGEPGGCTTDSSDCTCTKDADCDDGNACTGKETCSPGTLSCLPGTAIDCSKFTDQCNTGTCAPATGACSAVPKLNGTSCNDGNACTTPDTCQAGKCVGTPVVCTALDQCHVAGTCTGGVCSNPTKANGSACNDQNACTTADTCSGGSCIGGPPPTCADTNVCTVDGCAPASGCTFTAGNSGTNCAPATCSGGKETLAAACNGSLSQCPAGIVRDCAPYACGATSCKTKCTVDGDCSTGNYCAAGGICTPKGNAGTVCAANTQCLSNFCVDGVCCNDDCVGQCEACNLAGKVGMCSPVAGKPVGSRPACVGNGTGCDGACDGTQRTACIVPGQSKQCRAAACDAATDVATLAEFCNGSGSCPVARTQPCTPGVCGQTQCTGCSTNLDCPQGNFCRAGVCKPQSTTGTTCSLDAQCASGHCVDGVCCDNDCTGQCEACNQPNAIGKCTPIPEGKPPAEGRPGCTNAGKAPCGGACDGTTTRSCAYPGPGVSCRDAICANGIATLAAFCDGAGSCPAESRQTCPTGSMCFEELCSGKSDSCKSDADCNPVDYCAGGVCVRKSAAGTACNTATECGSGTCVDGVCCTQACGGQCQACNTPGKEGTCVAISGAPVGSRQACSSDGSDCGGSCDGITPDRCKYDGPTTPCRAGKCTGNLADLAAFCQGNGSCAPLQQQSCDPVGCDAAGVQCAGPCKKDADCKAAEYCSAGLCVAKLPNGSTCGSSSHCVEGNCVDGVCCDSPCDGQCQSCDQVGHIGECTSAVGAPRAGRPGCTGSSACGGFCDGTSGTTCAFPGTNVTCGQAFCAFGAFTKAAACNTAATCVLPAPSSCDPYQCDDTGGSCLTTCQVDTDCAPGLVCRNGACTQPEPPDAGVGPGGTPDAAVEGTGGTASVGGAAGSTGVGGAGAVASATGGRVSGGGGSTSVDAGLPSEPDSGKAPGHADGKDSGGCGCRVQGSERSDGRSIAGALAGLLILIARRRRQGNPGTHTQT